MATEPTPFGKLERTIAMRAKKPNPKSYTSQLLSGGVEKIGAKVLEEAAEVVEAAGEAGKAGAEHFVREVGDLIYHLLVLMRHQEASMAEVEAELGRRFGVSGIAEKASRKPAASAAPKKAAKVKPAAKIVMATPVKKKAKRKTRL